jgi:hypothetical protein
MKKILTLCIAMIFVASYSITAQNTATDTETATKNAADTKVECQDKENVKSSKQLTGFNFSKSNKYGKSSCSSTAKSSSCCSKTKAKKCSDTSEKACCSGKSTAKDTKKCSNACTKTCCTKDSNSKAMNKNAAEKVRTAIANNEISTKEGAERIAILNKKSEKSKN